MTIFSLNSGVLYLAGLVVFSSKRKHMLVMLLSLEFIVLSIYFLLFSHLNSMGYDYFFCMIYLTMSVCEGVLGLSILVMMIRNHGNDYILSFSSLW
uniref:NADH-ubiquinone oxidoreductase chain 4L n=2 Tax=Coleoptera TaxID=7041 RepID=A0A346RKQ3_9COLE|nr:NADH dehydrogenase subunit 4L [Curculionoidea sp. 9 KM-2017]AXS66650.1 NADH dehydrogenase subunit 4L [Coleoptera sp. 32 KM-2017]